MHACNIRLTWQMSCIMRYLQCGPLPTCTIYHYDVIIASASHWILQHSNSDPVLHTYMYRYQPGCKAAATHLTTKKEQVVANCGHGSPSTCQQTASAAHEQWRSHTTMSSWLDASDAGVTHLSAAVTCIRVHTGCSLPVHTCMLSTWLSTGIAAKLMQ